MSLSYEPVSPVGLGAIRRWSSINSRQSFFFRQNILKHRLNDSAKNFLSKCVCLIILVQFDESEEILKVREETQTSVALPRAR